MPQAYMEIALVADGQLQERLVALLSELGVEAFWEDAGMLRGYIRSCRWTPGLESEIARVISLVTRPSASPLPSFSVRKVDDENWNAAWEATIRPIRVTSRIVIAPSWHPAEPAEGEVVLTIDPKMSFGTGYHETTRLSLRLLERHLRPGATVLDVGTGTGVLAIAALRLGFRAAVGIDVDEWSYENALENAALNGVADRLSVRLCELDAVGGTFDLILANIQRSVLEPLLGGIAGHLNPGGRVILSGLLDIDETPMRDALDRAGFAADEVLREHEWIALSALLSPPA